jgi:hypothetical protein
MRITPSDDLKHLGTEDDQWQLVPPDMAGAALAAAFLACLILDRVFS